MQMHLYAPYLPDSASVAANVRRFRDELGMEIYVTEFDVDIREIEGTDEERFAYQAQVVRDMFAACVEGGARKSFVVFGLHYGSSWRESQDSRADPLFFDNSLELKPAYDALREKLSRLPTDD
jgi:GH35 family endo-1,4-beta-xylanase